MSKALMSQVMMRRLVIPRLRASVSMCFLGARVGDRGDAGLGEFGGVVEGEGAPAAAEFEDVLAVGELGALGVEGEHVGFGLVEGFFAGGVEAAGVFEVFAQTVLVEGGGDLVVLLVGGGGLFGERAGFEVGYVGGDVVGGGLVFNALREETADADADEPVGEEVFFEEGVDHVGNFFNREWTRMDANSGRIGLVPISVH
jgi:hypothetical protein